MSPVPLEGQQLMQQQPQHQQLQQLLQQSHPPPHQQFHQLQQQQQQPPMQQQHDQVEHHQEHLPMLPALPDGQRGGTISLGTLIDFIVQRTYNDLTVLAEL